MNQMTRKRGRPRSFSDKPEHNTNQSLDRAIDVLDGLAASQGLTLSEIAEELGQSPATIYRLLNTFEKRGIVDLDAVSQKWFIGPSLFRLGSAFVRRTSLLDHARPVMRELMQATGETANLGIERDGMVLFLSQVETHSAIRAFFPPGSRAPLHASGIGKALMSRFEPDRVEQVLANTTLEQFTIKTLIAPDQIRADLAQARIRGWALDDEEKSLGMRCVASPVVNHYGEVVAGISVSGPLDRMADEKLVGIGKTVKAAADTLSQRMGAPRA